MTDSLVEEYSIVGLAREARVDLLGERDIMLNRQDVIQYFVKMNIVDPVGFTIYFDENDIVQSYELTRY